MVNELYLSQIVFNKQPSEKSESNSFLNLQNVFNAFFHDKILIQKKHFKKFNLDDFYKFCNLYLDKARALNIKELTKSANVQFENFESKTENIFIYIKLMILFFKYTKGNYITANFDKNLIINKVKIQLNLNFRILRNSY